MEWDQNFGTIHKIGGKTARFAVKKSSVDSGCRQGRGTGFIQIGTMRREGKAGNDYQRAADIQIVMAGSAFSA